MTFGYSRDDAGTFLPQYVAGGILPNDPFQVRLVSWCSILAILLLWERFHGAVY